MQKLDRDGVTPTDVKEFFDYCDGNLIWKKTNRKGKVAGSLHPDGYVTIHWKNKIWMAHRLVWLWHENKLDKSLEIDHINRKRNDNRIENLRQVNRSLNNANRKACFVNECKGIWKAYTSRVVGNGKQIHLGCFKTKEEAEAAVACYLEGDSRVGFTWPETH